MTFVRTESLKVKTDMFTVEEIKLYGAQIEACPGEERSHRLPRDWSISARNLSM